MISANPSPSARGVGDVKKMKLISADSHVTEPPNCYFDFIDPKYRERAPHIVHDAVRGDLYVIDGLPDIVPMGLMAAAGEPPKAMDEKGKKFEDIRRGGWKAKDRLADQERDGIAAEIVYPSVGLLLCNHPDYDYKHACFKAYNRWLQGYVSDLPGRVFGIGQTAARTPEELVNDLHEIKKAGFVGVMLPGIPAIDDYDSHIYDPVWSTAVELDLPISFHVLTSSNANPAAIMRGELRGPRINNFHHLIRATQDIIGMFIYTGVFDRYPELKLVSAEGDAGWVPHLMQRMDHAHKTHRFHMKGIELAKLPSEYMLENVYLTFQDDWMAFRLAGYMNPKRLLWANDFPHSDSTWPHSQELLVEHGSHLDDATLADIVHNNTATLYGLKV